MGQLGGAREGAGRPKGTTNELILENQALIREAGVVPFLLNAFKTGQIEGVNGAGSVMLSLEQRLSVAQFLAQKFMPSQKAVEVSGEGGGEMIIKMINYGDKK